MVNQFNSLYRRGLDPTQTGGRGSSGGGGGGGGTKNEQDRTDTLGSDDDRE